MINVILTYVNTDRESEELEDMPSIPRIGEQVTSNDMLWNVTNVIHHIEMDQVEVFLEAAESQEALEPHIR